MRSQQTYTWHFPWSMKSGKSRNKVTEAFVCPYDAGLVYRKEALVNWCCSLQSAISDIEVDRLHLTGPTELAVPGYSKPVNLEKMYDHLQTGRLSTACPETMLGDTAITVHPEDPCYTHLHAQRLLHPLRRETIPVITDTVVDPEFWNRCSKGHTRSQPRGQSGQGEIQHSIPLHS
ncbi:hypothetical protein O3P69_016900 [Scylla paramamosain]|uniref:valine--tRNA ligase n=1 Tax=Scylla paramamosain TaxID=85552 RepID=A0AAW0T0T5_SCYPA